MDDLKHSGFNEKERLRILKGGFKTVENLQKKVNNGERPFFRSANFKKEDRKNEKDKNKNEWFKKSNPNYKSVMFVDATPNSELIRLLKEAEKNNMIDENNRIKFVEKVGVKTLDYLKVDDPFRTNCSKDDCLACHDGDKVKETFSN